MTGSASISPDQLPAAIRGCLAAHVAGDVDTALCAFTPTAVVVDDGGPTWSSRRPRRASRRSPCAGPCGSGTPLLVFDAAGLGLFRSGSPALGACVAVVAFVVRVLALRQHWHGPRARVRVRGRGRGRGRNRGGSRWSLRP